MVHFHVRPARSVTYWPSGVLFVCVTCVLPHPFVCARSWRASVSCLARFPGAHLVLCVNSLRAVVVGVGARVYSFSWVLCVHDEREARAALGLPARFAFACAPVRVSFSCRRGAAPCGLPRSGTCCGRCRGRPSCSRGAVGDAFFGVCAVPRFAEVLCAAVDAAQRGFDGAHIRVCRRVVCSDFLVPVVVYEAGAVAFDADGDGHLVVVADVGGEVSLLFVGETVPRVGERVHDREVCGAGTEGRCGFGDLVDLGGVHGWVSFSLVVGVFLVLVLV